MIDSRREVRGLFKRWKGHMRSATVYKKLTGFLLSCSHDLDTEQKGRSMSGQHGGLAAGCDVVKDGHQLTILYPSLTCTAILACKEPILATGAVHLHCISGLQRNDRL
jgi:hypothetical protein